MARSTSMLSRTALPEGCKVATASMEFLRRAKNTSRLLPTQNIEEEMERYALDLRRGWIP